MARTTESTGVEAAMELIIQEGFEGLGEAVRTLINEAMRIERSRHLGAGPWERAEERQLPVSDGRGATSLYCLQNLEQRAGRKNRDCLVLHLESV